MILVTRTNTGDPAFYSNQTITIGKTDLIIFTSILLKECGAWLAAKYVGRNLLTFPPNINLQNKFNDENPEELNNQFRC